MNTVWIKHLMVPVQFGVDRLGYQKHKKTTDNENRENY